MVQYTYAGDTFAQDIMCVTHELLLYLFQSSLMQYGSDKPDTRYNMEVRMAFIHLTMDNCYVNVSRVHLQLQCLDHIWEQTRKDDETQVHLQGFKIEQWEVCTSTASLLSVPKLTTVTTKINV